jgi:hypothetical protein
LPSHSLSHGLHIAPLVSAVHMEYCLSVEIVKA